MREEMVIGMSVILPYRLLYNNFAWEKYMRTIMSTKSTKLILIMSLLSGTLLCILGCNAIPNIKKALSPNPNSIPVKSLRITIDVKQREELFYSIP
jgi:hypothetical protein